MKRRPKYNFTFDDLMGRVPVPPEHICDKDGCGKPAEYRAPKDRTLSDYYWFCLEHVQEYNAQWDFYQGMTPEEIEEELKMDVCWQRPTWKLGERETNPAFFADPLGVKKEAFGDGEQAQSHYAEKTPQTDAAVLAAAKVLELAFPLELKNVRMNYKRLAKLYHPDSNGGNKELEEKFKDITEAYRLIISVLNAQK